MHDTQAMTRQLQRITGGHLAHRSRGVTHGSLGLGAPEWKPLLDASILRACACLLSTKEETRTLRALVPALQKERHIRDILGRKKIFSIILMTLL